jgi:hypothetical protein
MNPSQHPHFYPRARTDLITQDVAGEIVILDQQRNQVHRLNASASLIWRQMDGRASLEELAAALSRHFEVTTAQATDDVARVVEGLDRAGLLTT